MRFWKMNGAGNDFIILNGLEEKLPPEELPALVRALCRRRLSIGADGLMVVEPPRAGGDYRMRFFNSDGAEAEMCGNGARCICRYGYENGLAGTVQHVETAAGPVTGERIDRRNYRIRLNDPAVLAPEFPVTLDGKRWDCSYVELGDPGVPHAAVPLPGLRDWPEDELRRLGRGLRYHPAFPRGANVNFYEVTGPDRLYARTYERGVEDFTLACGTGSGAMAAALTLRGAVSGRGVEVETAGGVLRLDVTRDGERITGLFLTGPTNVVAVGEITDEELPGGFTKEGVFRYDL